MIMLDDTARCFKLDHSAESSLGKGVLSKLELTRLLGGSQSHGFLLVLGETSSAGLGSLASEILGGVLLLLPLASGGSSPLHVDNGEGLGDSLTDNSNASQLDLRGR